MEGNITISRVRSGQPASMRHGLPHRVRRRKAAQRHARIAAEPPQVLSNGSAGAMESRAPPA